MSRGGKKLTIFWSFRFLAYYSHLSSLKWHFKKVFRNIPIPEKPSFVATGSFLYIKADSHLLVQSWDSVYWLNTKLTFSSGVTCGQRGRGALWFCSEQNCVPVVTWCSLFPHHSGTTMWRCGTEWTRAASWWGSTAGKSPRLPSSRLETNSSSSSCQITRRTGRDSPSVTRSSRRVSGLLWDSVSPPLKISQLTVPFMQVYFSISQSVNQLLLTLTLY